MCVRLYAFRSFQALIDSTTPSTHCRYRQYWPSDVKFASRFKSPTSIVLYTRRYRAIFVVWPKNAILLFFLKTTIDFYRVRRPNGYLFGHMVYVLRVRVSMHVNRVTAVLFLHNFSRKTPSQHRINLTYQSFGMSRKLTLDYNTQSGKQHNILL